VIDWVGNLPVLKKIGWFVLVLTLLGFAFVVCFFGLRRILGRYLEWQENLKESDRIVVKWLVGLGILASIGLILWIVPAWQVAKLQGLDNKHLFDKENEARKTIAQILGGLALLIGIYFTWRRITATEKSLEITRGQLLATERNLEIARDGQITERFTRAIEQLASKNLEVRLGGIYALERIARDSEKDHWPIMEVLTAYVRKNAPRLPEPTSPQEGQTSQSEELPGANQPDHLSVLKKISEYKRLEPLEDIQAILTVIGRRTRTYGKGEDQSLDLRETDLSFSNLYKAHLEAAFLLGACLSGAKLIEARMEGAYLRGVELSGADLTRAQLEGADLKYAELRGVKLKGANLLKANIEGAKLWGPSSRPGKRVGFGEGPKKDQIIQARCWPLSFLGGYSLIEALGLEQNHNERLKNRDLSGYNLENTDLCGAYLERFNIKEAILKGAGLRDAYLRRADLERADLREAHLEGADLKGAKGLTEEQIRQAIIDENTKLPDYLKHLEKSSSSKPKEE
jgi:uncharacterized protein YjbI with pentapeptide repeats